MSKQGRSISRRKKHKKQLTLAKVQRARWNNRISGMKMITG